jgi:Spy/CpxP family protein refolding chaperone
MRKTSLFFALMLITALGIFAQTANQTSPQKPADKPSFSKENMQAMKIAFITKQLNITEQQATTFWPVYNKYEAEKKALRKSVFGEAKPEKPLDEMTNEDADKMINNYLDFKTKELELSKKYVAEFKKVLDAKQVAKLITSENHFKNMLMQHGKSGGGKSFPGGKQEYQRK